MSTHLDGIVSNHQKQSIVSSSEMLDCQRDLFDLPDKICWLNSAFMSPLLKTVQNAGLEGVRRRGQPWNITADDFFEPAERVRELYGGLIGANAESISIVPSVSYAIGIAVANLPIRSGDNIVVVEEQFPSNIYPWRDAAKKQSAMVRTVSIPQGDWTEAILSVIDENTAVVAIPHIHWTTGAQFDLKRISKVASANDAALVVDATQSLGVLPLKVNEVQPDFLVAAGYKCMLGPYGLTYLYVSPKWQEGIPLEQAWLNRQNANDFANLTHYCDDYAAGARRFDMGERSSTILLPMAIESLSQLTRWKIAAIENYTRPLIQYIINQADALGYSHPCPETCSPCMVGIGLPDNVPGDVARRLSVEGVYVSIRKGNARVAPHIYNTREDVDRFFQTLSRLILQHGTGMPTN